MAAKAAAFVGFVAQVRTGAGCGIIVGQDSIPKEEIMSPKDRADELRRERNRSLMSELDAGYNGHPVDMRHYFFPPRPLIKKDPKALEITCGIKKKAETKLLPITPE